MNQALDILEICDEIAQYLRRQDSLACILVSKRWYDAFTPSLWSKVTLDRNSPQSVVWYLSKHSSLVETLILNRFNFMQPLFESLSFPRLKSFSIEYRLRKGTSARARGRNTIVASADKEEETVEGDEDGDFHLLHDIVVDSENRGITEDDFGPFIEKHGTTLTTLRIELTQETPPLTLEWMAQCRILKSFDLSIDSEVPWLDYVRIWRSCQLESIRLKVSVPRAAHTISNIKRTVEMDDVVGCLPVKKLTLSLNGVPVDHQLWFTKLCDPTLEDLTLACISRQEQPMAFFTQAMKDGSFPRLTKLLTGYQGPDDQSLAEMVSARLPVGFQELRFTWSGSGPLTWKALQNSSIHLNSLQCLQLKYSNTTGPMISEMLQSMPNLREFAAGVLSDTDMNQDEMSSRPWICLRLESLDITLMVQGGKTGHAMFFDRIALLTQLRVLSVADHNERTDHGRQYLFFSLEYGLDVLKSLGRNLVELYMRDTGSLSKEDIDWMIAYWPHIVAGRAPFLKLYNNAKRIQEK